MDHKWLYSDLNKTIQEIRKLVKKVNYLENQIELFEILSGYNFKSIMNGLENKTLEIVKKDT